MNTSTRIAGVVSGLALAAGVATGIPFAASGADNSKPAACAQQQKQVDKAEDALARATANFAKVKKSDAKPAKAEKVAKAKKVKKAQVQRLAKAKARLATCLAEQPTATPTPTPTPTPTATPTP